MRANVAEHQDFALLFSKLAEVRRDADDGKLQLTVEHLQKEGDAISKLMLAAGELAEPRPAFFTRA